LKYSFERLVGGLEWVFLLFYQTTLEQKKTKKTETMTKSTDCVFCGVKGWATAENNECHSNSSINVFVIEETCHRKLEIREILNGSVPCFVVFSVFFSSKLFSFPIRRDPRDKRGLTFARAHCKRFSCHWAWKERSERNDLATFLTDEWKIIDVIYGWFFKDAILKKLRKSALSKYVLAKQASKNNSMGIVLGF